MNLQISVLPNSHLIVVSSINHFGIELPAMYKVNTFNPMDSRYPYICKI